MLYSTNKISWVQTTSWSIPGRVSHQLSSISVIHVKPTKLSVNACQLENTSSWLRSQPSPSPNFTAARHTATWLGTAEASSAVASAWTNTTGHMTAPQVQFQMDAYTCVDYVHKHKKNHPEVPASSYPETAFDHPSMSPRCPLKHGLYWTSGGKSAFFCVPPS